MLNDNSEDQSVKFTLPGIRLMLQRGQITQEEFDTLKKIVIAETKADRDIPQANVKIKKIQNEE